MQSLLSQLPSELSIPTFAEMRERTRRLQGRGDVSVCTVGADREGEPIELISLGNGPTNVLVIGAPHPNEPIGCIGIEWLIEQFTADAELLRQTGCRWHFVKAIEPYALKQNEGWFKQPDVTGYLQHYYRPVSSAQAEYSFPPTSAAGRPWQPVPENEAYRQALRIAQPDLLVSMHNAEASGAFFFISRDDVALANRLSAQALAQGLPLNLLGEAAPDVRETPLAPGVFLLQEEDHAAEGSCEHPGLAVTTWLVGQATRPPLFLVPEVPLFLAGKASHVFASMDACLDAVRELSWGARLEALLHERLTPMDVAATPMEQLYLSAIREAAPLSIKLLDALPGLKTRAETGGSEDHARAQLLLALRPMAMARRVAAMRAARAELGELRDSAQSTEQECARDLALALESPVLRNALAPAPLRAVVATQLEALLAAVEAVTGV